MEKNRLERFISKYNLNGTCESVTYKSDGNALTVRAQTEDRSVLGEVSLEASTFPAGNFAVFDTKKLRSILNVLGETLTIQAVKNSTTNEFIALRLSDTEKITATFVLADVAVIPRPADINRLPPMDLTLQLDEVLMNMFIKARGALQEATSFTVSSDGEQSIANIVVGDASINTNRIQLEAKISEPVEFSALTFPADHFRNILMANRDAKSGTMEISSRGISVIKFANDGFTTTYYMTA